MSDDRGWYPDGGRGGRGDGDDWTPGTRRADGGPAPERAPRDPRRQPPPAPGGRRQPPAPYGAEPGRQRPDGYGAEPPARGGRAPRGSYDAGYDAPPPGRRGPAGPPPEPPRRRSRDADDAYGAEPYGGDARGRPAYGADPYGEQYHDEEPRRDERAARRGSVDTWSPAGGVPPQARTRGGRRAGRPAPEEADAWQPEADRSEDYAAADGRGGRSRSAEFAEPDGRDPRRPQRAGRSARAGAAAVEGNINEDLDLDELMPKRAATGPKARRRKALKWTAIGVSSVLVLVLAVGAYFVKEFSGNIQHQSLLQNGESQAPEAVNKFGQSAMNILIIGSDTRDTAADCSLGGACQKGASNAGANADVEMVVHLSADRTNATVMSIPRDTMTNLPACTDAQTGAHGSGGLGQINSTLDYGPSCTVEAVHDLTGLTIDHFIMVDFSGVVTMSDALGGVPVCVSAAMYDKDSGLRLPAGTSVVKGQQALEFVRTRHGFYDGSDLGREKAQHYFLSAMIREVRQNLNLTDLPTLVSIANAATKALTVDNGLSGVTSLVDLAETLNKVPTDKITFVTMPWEYDPTNNNRVLPLYPEATQMFDNIKNDVSYTAVKSAKPAASPTASPVVIPSPTVQVADSTVHVQVQNGGGVPGRASTITNALVTAGFSDATDGGNANSAATTMLYYPSSRADSAAAVAHALGIPTTHMQVSSAYTEVTVVIGSDWSSGTTFSTASSSTAAGAATAPADSSEELASTTGGCITVNPADVVNN